LGTGSKGLSSSILNAKQGISLSWWFLLINILSVNQKQNAKFRRIRNTWTQKIIWLVLILNHIINYSLYLNVILIQFINCTMNIPIHFLFLFSFADSITTRQKYDKNNSFHWWLW
jgi:hypothetical protein